MIIAEILRIRLENSTVNKKHNPFSSQRASYNDGLMAYWPLIGADYSMPLAVSKLF